MKRYEKILKEQYIHPLSKIEKQWIYNAMKQFAWEAWHFSCEAFYKINGMEYGDKQMDIEKRAFEEWWNMEVE